MAHWLANTAVQIILQMGADFGAYSKLYHNVVWFGMAVYHKINNIKDGQSGLSL